jgi:hypothetical protein
VLTRAVRSSRVAYPYQAAQILLALAGARRCAGQEEEAVAAWCDVVGLTAALLAPPLSVNDPILWKHLAALRPLTTPWPPVAGEQLAPRSGATLGSLKFQEGQVQQSRAGGGTWPVGQVRWPGGWHEERSRDQ